MSNHRGLIGKLLKLAEQSSIQDGWRRVGRALDRDPLAALLREIDETQLPRELSFRNDQGHVLRVEAGNRRLRRIVSASWSDPGKFGNLSEKELSNPTEVEIDAIGGLFRAIQPGDQTVWVRSAELSDADEGSSTGLRAATMARAWSIDLDERSDENLTRAFANSLKALMPLADAWIRFENGAVTEVSDPEPDSDWRDRWSSIDRSQFRNGSGPIHDAPELCILGSGVAREPHHVVATFGTTCVVMHISAANVTEIAQNWRDLGL